MKNVIYLILFLIIFGCMVFENSKGYLARHQKMVLCYNAGYNHWSGLAIQTYRCSLVPRGKGY